MTRTRMSLAALAIAAMISPLQAATLVFSDDFNADVLDDDTDSLLNWTVSNGRVGVHGPGSFDDYPGNGNYVDMDGASANAGKITTRQTFALIPGLTYTLSFDLGKSGRSFAPERLTFGLGDWDGPQIRLPATPIPNLIRWSYDFTVTVTSGNLWFNAFGGDNYGPIIDDVNLEVYVPPVPLPSSGAALLGGIAGVWLAARGVPHRLRRGGSGPRPAAAR